MFLADTILIVFVIEMSTVKTQVTSLLASATVCALCDLSISPPPRPPPPHLAERTLALLEHFWGEPGLSLPSITSHWSISGDLTLGAGLILERSGLERVSKLLEITQESGCHASPETFKAVQCAQKTGQAGCLPHCVCSVPRLGSCKMPPGALFSKGNEVGEYF